MAKKTTASAKTKTAKAAKPAKAAPIKKAPKQAAAPGKPRHPRGRVAASHGSKADLAKTLASQLARSGEDTAALESRLSKASNQQLLRLSRVTSTVKAKYGDRDKLIAAIAGASKQGKDQDYAAKLGAYSLPQLLDLATTAARRAR